MKDAVLRRVASQRWLRLHSDVFLVDRPHLDWGGAEMAAVLQFRGFGVLSGRSAAGVWGLVDDLPEVVELTLVGRGAKPKPGVVIRRVSHLHHKDVRHRKGIPLTAPARTLLDLAAAADGLELESALAVARLHGLVNDRDLKETIDRAPGRSGVKALNELLQRLGPDTPARTRSHYERKLLSLIEQAELPRPVTNVPVEGLEVDLFWPQQKLIVEFDSIRFHGDRQAFERDRLRDQRLIAAGYRVIRITALQLERTPYAVLARLAQALGSLHKS